ncbi:MAG: hypothetical protein ABJZ62_03135 [Hyphomicrobiales bacterium]
MQRLVQFFCLVILTTSFVISDIHAPILGETSIAHAQEKKPTFFQRLFGKKKKRLQQVPKTKTKTRRKKNVKKRRKNTSKTRKAIAALPKIDDANRIVVIGDSTAESISKGLVESYKRTPSVVISPRIQKDISIVGDKFYTWLDASDFTFLGDRVRAVVIALGSFDRGPIASGGKTEAFGTPQWERAYRRRLVDVSAQLQLLNKPIIWVLPPPVIDDENTEMAVAISEIQRSAVEPLNFRVVDVHGGFLNREGKFRHRGVSINGNRVQLRDGLGIGFTKSGSRKIAYYVQKEIDDILDAQLNQGLQLQAGTTKRNAQQIAILTRPALIQGATLAGGNGRVSAFYKDERARDYFVGGKSLVAPKGRADDFSWVEPKQEDPALSQ